MGEDEIKGFFQKGWAKTGKSGKKGGYRGYKNMKSGSKIVEGRWGQQILVKFIPVPPIYLFIILFIYVSTHISIFLYRR